MAQTAFLATLEFTASSSYFFTYYSYKKKQFYFRMPYLTEKEVMEIFPNISAITTELKDEPSFGGE
jgi:hypothetical protein